MRALQPDRSGAVIRDGVSVAYDLYGEGHAQTVFLLPTWTITHSMHWKCQVPALARHYRVITSDGRGHGRSDRPQEPAAYTVEEYVADAVAILDETGTDRALVAGVSRGGVHAAFLAADHPDRVAGLVLIAPALNIGPNDPAVELALLDADAQTDEGLDLFSEKAWRRAFPKFAQAFWETVFSEPHSTKPIEDAVGWQLETDAETLIATVRTPRPDREETAARLLAIRCPSLVIHGTDDVIVPTGAGEATADLIGADLLLLDGSGHCPQSRDPVRVNSALLDFFDRASPIGSRPPRRTTWTRAQKRTKKVLYLSSPIGLGHVRRDHAIARELRARHEDVQVDWLSQDPVTMFLEAAGESVHPASAYLSSEVAHIDAEAGEHDLHAFQAIRQMDEILVANFGVVQDVVESGGYDLVVGDEAWDVDYFWHENPELKRASYAWMTDFVGWLPMPDGGDREAMLTADYNAEMIEQVERFRRVRDRSIFVGDPDDIVPDTFGPGLPGIREWTEQHYDFSGYVTGLDGNVFEGRTALRRRLGHSDAPLVVVTVGGSGVGSSLLRKVIDAYPRMRKEVDGLRMLVAAGPRVDVASLPSYDGVDVRGYVADLPHHLAACDAAIVQGGLTTTMELVATGRPFLYFPLGHHFEQQRHVRHRLQRHGAGRCLDFATTDADDIATALVDELSSTSAYLPVPTDGARRAARLLAELL
jgi:pimeloyl-ACP methyl ester carboxylesterase/predicted glycosyltransferase